MHFIKLWNIHERAKKTNTHHRQITSKPLP